MTPRADILEVNPLVLYIPCCAHSLNLIGQCAVDCCQTAVAFLDFVQYLYVHIYLNFYTSVVSSRK